MPNSADDIGCPLCPRDQGLKPLAILGDPVGVTTPVFLDPEGVTGNSQGLKPLVHL